MLDATNDVTGDTPADRLRRARINAGYPSARAFCMANDLTIHTYYSHERGHRGFSAEIAAQYAALLGVSPSALLYGGSLRDNVRIPIVGSIGEQGHVTMSNDPKRKTANLGAIANMESLTVQGHSLYPFYSDGDLVYCQPLRRDWYDIRDLHGYECIVELQGGDRLVRKLMVEPDARITLMGYNHNMPPIYDADVVAASPIEYVQRKPPPSPRRDRRLAAA